MPFEYHGYRFEKIGYNADRKLEYRIVGPGIDEIRATPHTWQIFKGAAEAIAAELAGVESANLDTNMNPRQKRTVKRVTQENDTSAGTGWFVSKW